MAATNYMTKIYNIHRAGEDVDYSENVSSASGSSQTSTSAIAIIGPLRYAVNGTVAGATVKLQALDPNSAWQDIAGTTATDVVDQLVDFPPFVSNTVKAIIADASSGSDFNVWLQAGLGRDIY